MNEINFTSVQHVQNENGDNFAYKIVVDGKTSFVSYGAGNRHYDEIMRQVNAGTLTIQDAD